MIDLSEVLRGRGKPDKVRVIKVIEVTAIQGSGAEDDLCYFMKQYWSFDGELLAEEDVTNKLTH